MNGDNHFSVKETLNTAWLNVKGIKWAVWVPLLVMIAISIGISFVVGILKLGLGQSSILDLIVTVATTLLTAALIVGAQMVALKHLRKESIQPTSGLQYWDKWWQLGLSMLVYNIGFYVIILVVAFIGILIVGLPMTIAGTHPVDTSLTSGMIVSAIFVIAIPGLILCLLYQSFFSFNLLFIADKNKGPMEGLLSSAKMVKKHWLKVALSFLVLFAAFFVIMIPMFLGGLAHATWLMVIGTVFAIVVFVIWGMPYTFSLIATIYQKLSDSHQASVQTVAPAQGHDHEHDQNQQ